MRLSPSTCGALLTLAVFAAPADAALTFGDFVTSSAINAVEGQNQTIGFAYAGNKFVGSVYNGINNNQLYTTDLGGGSVAKFGAPITGFGGEIYVTASLGLGGFGSGSTRDIYAGSETGGAVWKITNDGTSQAQFAGGGGSIVGGVRSLAFDPYGLYGNQLIVATNAGNVYRVSNGGVATLLANVGEDAEGLSFAPQAFGSFAKGTLFVASEGSGSLRAINAGGTITPVIGAGSTVAGIAGAEMVSFVPLNLGSSGNTVEGFYAAAFPNNIQKAGASQFAPYLGDAVITSETGRGVFDVHFNGTTFVVTNIGTFPAQPEDGIFVTADIVQNPVPEPETYALMLAGFAAMGWAMRRPRRPSVG
jgi:hypothetical protein